MDFKKNELISDVFDANFDTWGHTQNRGDYVSDEYLHKVDNIIFDNMKKQLKQVDIYHLLYLQDQGVKLGFFQKLKIYFSGLRPLYNAEKRRLEQEELARQAQISDRVNEPAKNEQTFSLVPQSEANIQIQTPQSSDS